MKCITQVSQDKLNDLGERLKSARLDRNETQAEFAARLGMSRNTYARMEKGDPNIGIGFWVLATDLLGLLDCWDHVCKKELDLFAQQDKQNTRKRARKKID